MKRNAASPADVGPPSLVHLFLKLINNNFFNAGPLIGISSELDDGVGGGWGGSKIEGAEIE